MDIAARVTSKGQVTVPKEVRNALGIEVGDQLVFRVAGDHAVVARTPDLLDVAGAVEIPAAKRGVSWDQIRSATRLSRGADRR